MIAMSWHLHRKNTVRFRRNPFSPHFLLAVHMLTASKRRKEKACCQGEGTPAWPREARQQLRQDAVSPFPAHLLVTGLLAKVSGQQLGGGKAVGTAEQGEGTVVPLQNPTSQTEHQDHHSADVGDATCL